MERSGSIILWHPVSPGYRSYTVTVWLEAVPWGWKAPLPVRTPIPLFRAPRRTRVNGDNRL